MDRDCNHPDFPLRRASTVVRDTRYERWAAWIGVRETSFGSVIRDPTGKAAWALYLAEHSAWATRHDPRAGFRIPAVIDLIGRWCPTWIIAGGPLDRFDVAIVDARCGILLCRHCGCKWRVLFRDGVYVANRCLRCPKGCEPLRGRRSGEPSLKAVKESLRIAAASDFIPTIERRTTPVHVFVVHAHNFDCEAEVQGLALRRLKRLAIRQPRRKRSRVLSVPRFEKV